MNKSSDVKILEDLLPVNQSLGQLVVRCIQLDSRKIDRGDLFVALPGYAMDGRAFIFDALKNGAVAVLAEAEGYDDAHQSQFPHNVIWVTGLRLLLGSIADKFYSSPSSQMKVFAVTGTNGKTTVSHLLARLCSLMHDQASVIGTLGYGHPDRLVSLENTTPDVITLHSILRQMLDEGIDCVAMEASSHGLDQGRMDGVLIQTAIATNLTRDHLDYHQTMEAYFQAKASIAHWSGLRHLIVNDDDPWIRRMSDLTSKEVKVIRFSLHASSTAEVRLLKSTFDSSGATMSVLVGDAVYAVRTSLLGDFNIANILAVASALWVNGYEMKSVFAALEALNPVPGRMERVCIPELRGPVVVVDYAHTPDALEQVLKSLRHHCHDHRLWCVFGCGGNRDKGKRSMMGAIAAQLSDHVVITTDNPRFESAQAIIEEIGLGISDSNHVNVIPDRAAAINFAIRSAEEGDLVLLAGKGHEDYQEVAGIRYYFSDREVAMNVLNDLFINVGKV